METQVPAGSTLKITLKASTYVADLELMHQILDKKYQCYLPTDRDDGDYLIEFAGRQCYESFHNPVGRTTAEYIENIIQLQHFSVLEHVNVTFHLEGVSRNLTHELIRHRHFSFSQLSQRYVDQTDLTYVIPPLIKGDWELEREYITITERNRADLRRFQDLILARYPNAKKKEAREASRYALAQGIETKIVVTGNLRTWLEFLPKRMSPYADKEFQSVAKEIYRQLKEKYPSTFREIENGNTRD